MAGRWVIDSRWVTRQRIPVLGRRIVMTCSLSLEPDMAGAQYNPQVLAGLSAAQIAGQLSNPSSPVARAIDGSAQVIVAAIDRVRHETGT